MGFYDAATLFLPFLPLFIHRSRAMQMQTNKTIFPTQFMPFLAKMDVYIIRY